MLSASGSTQLVRANYRRQSQHPPVHRFASSLDMLELVFDSTGMVLTKGAYPTTDNGRPQAWLEDLAQRVRPVTLAGEQLLPVPRALEPLLPDRGLRRGGTVAVDGSLALALALVAGASAAGSWVVAVGLPDLGVVAAAEAGIVLERLALVPRAGAAAWGAVVAALLDAIDVVLVRPPARLSAAVARRLAARARERRSVLLLVGAGWPIPPDLRLAVTASQWEGLGQGDGRLEARKVEVAAAGRGAAVLERRAKLWLPSPAAQQGAGPRHDRYVRAVEEGRGIPRAPHPRAAFSSRCDGWRCDRRRWPVCWRSGALTGRWPRRACLPPSRWPCWTPVGCWRARWPSVPRGSALANAGARRRSAAQSWS